MIFPRAAIYLQMIKYIPREEAIDLINESVRIGVTPDRSVVEMIDVNFIFIEISKIEKYWK